MFPQGFLDKYQAQLSKADFDQFLEFCQKPLRKSIRVNTLKISVEDFQKIAEEKGWELEPIPWCEEGFWIERENRDEPLGNSIEHFLGLFYIQEASSMIPPEILNPQLGERVLDMAAAPGSKTTQLAAKMQNEGVLASNEPVVKRIKGMVSNLERLGASCVVVSRKDGQFFGENTPNFFDKILLDAPCTGEGTVRKDPKALENWSQENIEGMARLQKQLIKSAFEALKPGGVMVYSTCTLAREENEEVVEYLLEEFEGNAELVPFSLKPPLRGVGGVEDGEVQSEENFVILASSAARKSPESKSQVEEDFSTTPAQDNLKGAGFGRNDAVCGMMTIWPQLFDSEGFFVAKIRKNEKTEFKKLKKKKHFTSKYRVLRNNEVELIQEYLEERFAYTRKLVNLFKLYQKENQVYFCPKEIREIDKRIYLERRGFHVGEFLHKRSGITEFKIHHLGITILGDKFTKNILKLREGEVKKYLKGESIEIKNEKLKMKNGRTPLRGQGGVVDDEVQSDNLSNGVVVLKYRGVVLGKGLLKGENVKNQIPRYLIW